MHVKLVVPEQEHVPPLSLNHVTSVTPTASLAVPVTLNESLVVEDGSDVEMETVGAVVSDPPSGSVSALVVAITRSSTSNDCHEDCQSPC